MTAPPLPDPHAPAARERFAWPELRARVDELAQAHRLVLDTDRAAIDAIDAQGIRRARLWPPRVIGIPADCATVDAWLAHLPTAPGLQVVLLLRAGAAALGLWRDDELVRHKVIKKYVVRGHGKAQTTYRKTRGKSRAGSRLRLRNAQSLLDDVNDKLHQWRDAGGEFDRIHWQCPTRQWPELFAAQPAPPFARDDARLSWIPLSVREPCFEELLRVRRALAHGTIERVDPAIDAATDEDRRAAMRGAP